MSPALHLCLWVPVQLVSATVPFAPFAPGVAFSAGCGGSTSCGFSVACAGFCVFLACLRCVSGVTRIVVPYVRFRDARLPLASGWPSRPCAAHPRMPVTAILGGPLLVCALSSLPAASDCSRTGAVPYSYFTAGLSSHFVSGHHRQSTPRRSPRLVPLRTRRYASLVRACLAGCPSCFVSRVTSLWPLPVFPPALLPAA